MSFICACAYQTHVDEGGSIWTTFLEFLFLTIVIIFGIKINYKFIQKLKEEKRSKPLDRKGNVIEPIMRWFLWFQLIYWPYNIIYGWVNLNEIISTEAMNGWWCDIIRKPIQLGRYIVAYNSLFVAIIRYIYIVKTKVANQWKFENVGKWLAISSFSIPFALEIIKLFTNDGLHYKLMPKYNDCIDFYQGSNSSGKISSHTPIFVSWTLNYLSLEVVRTIHYTTVAFSVIVALNVFEVFLYFRINQSIQR